MKHKTLYTLGFVVAVVLLLSLAAALTALAVSGAAYTTFNAHVDGASKDVCKNSAINCNIYGAKEYVWLNGGPTANGLGPDGQYFFAVLVPGGQPNPNDGGAKNLSDDYDCYKNRQFTVTNGEVSAYSGFACGGSYPFQTKHWLDDGKSGPKPNGLVPYIRLFPYADTTNPGGVYILAICSLGDGTHYPVNPRDCKYDAFKVKKITKMEYSFFLSGIKFLDVNGDSGKVGDDGLSGWEIKITGTAPNGTAINATITTGAGGYWEWTSPIYTFTGGAQPQNVTVKVCETLQPGWTQTFPGGDGCHTFTFTPTGFNDFFNIDFGNGKPDIDVTKGCPTVVQVGHPVDYDFDVTNIGNVNLVNVDVKDPTVGFDNDPNISLPPGGTQHYDWQITPNTPEVINNTVYASGDYGATTVFATVNDSASCTTHVVDARISIRESGANGITEPHTFVVKVEKNDGSGWAPASVVVVAVSETGVGSIVGETCSAGTDASGQCTVTVNSNTAGSSTVNASADVTVEGMTIHVATDGYGAYYVSNIKTWVAGSLAWTKVWRDGSGQLHPLGGATFEVCRTQDRFGGVIDPAECVTVLDNNSPDANPSDGTFLLTGLKLGEYTIQETVPPTGFKGDSHVETVDLTTDNPDKVVEYVWVNLPFQGCTPGFWQGGNDSGTAGGKWLWDNNSDPQWTASGGVGTNPYQWTTLFNNYFGGGGSNDMWYYINPDLWGQGNNDDFHKAARDLVAAYLNASWGMNYPYTTTQLMQMWADAVNSSDFMSLHLLLDAANNAYNRTVGGEHCPISASGY